ncbi:MAG: hypothetical protein M3220_00350 [Chloroflexota bacterium]|nr:hypothetical protein [Chloroflexota bacterium]
MIERIQYALIWLADKCDHYILEHRFYRLCELIGQSEWWGKHVVTAEEYRAQEYQALANFLSDKRIVGVRCDDAGEECSGFDLLLEDGSELELYALPQERLGWITTTAEEAREREQEMQAPQHPTR